MIVDYVKKRASYNWELGGLWERKEVGKKEISSRRRKREIHKRRNSHLMA